MSASDKNTEPEQKTPLDVHRPPGSNSVADAPSKAPPAVQPPGVEDASERPVVNPVTGGTI